MSNKSVVPMLRTANATKNRVDIMHLADLIQHASQHYVWNARDGRVYMMHDGILYAARVGNSSLECNTDALYNVEFWPCKESCLISPFAGRLMDNINIEWHNRLSAGGVLCVVTNYITGANSEIRLVTLVRDCGAGYTCENGACFAYATPVTMDELKGYII
jgi:hypothetical protein